MSSSQKCIPEALLDAAARNDPRRGLTFVSDESDAFYSFEQTAAIVARYAAAMLRGGLRPGDRVALALPDSAEFVFSFLGAMHAGLIPVPLYPPNGVGKLGFYLTHAQHILRASGASMLVTSSQIRAVLGSLLNGQLRSITTVQSLGLDDRQAPLARLRPDDLAFLQFTSGSTSRPKGVALTYGNLSANIKCFTDRVRASSDDVGCSWLPLYHDMGLIGFVLAPILNGSSVVLMSPFVFLKRPVEWLRRITTHRATISFAPNFGYGLCASRVRERDRESLDLSSWRVAGCGAEPIQLATLENFGAKFEPAGFDRKAFILAYGMAENTLAVTFSTPNAPPRAERIRIDSLSADGLATPADEDDTSAVSVANCGGSFEGHEVAIMDADGNLCAPRQVGEIVARGPSMMKSYYNDPAATAEALRDGWLHTGDLGYLSGGELFVCGRIKDLIIVGGRNYYPSDIEWVVSDVQGVRRGRVVAFGVADAGGNIPERVVVCVETKLRPAKHESLAEEVRTRVLEVLGLKVTAVALLERGSLPRTSSGKLQRNRTRELYLSGKLAASIRDEGRLALAWRLAASQWGFLKRRFTSGAFGDQGG